ncbi:MAG TPA: hypothetical protein VNX68_04280, partial [Nitrosopumilaceae archaeon]|nr:hypothetical protein [Nitrosopumilaceae archaeon]
FNTWEIPFAIVVVLLIAVTQFFKYRKTDLRAFWRSMRMSVLIAFLFSSVACSALYFFEAYAHAPELKKGSYPVFAVLLFCSVFSIVANGTYWLSILKGKIKSAGASIAHIGFSMILLGALISTSKMQTLSRNTSKQSVESLGKDFKNQESILLNKGDTLPMGEYFVNYKGKEKEGINILFHVEYFKKDNFGKFLKQFDLYPLVQLNERMGNAAEPDTRHFFNRDIYTHVTYAPPETMSDESRKNEYDEPVNNVIHVGDTIFATNAIIVLDSFRTSIKKEEYEKNDSAITVTAVLKAYDINSKVRRAYPKYILRNNQVEPESDEIDELGLKFSFWKINPDQGSVEITMAEKQSNKKDFIVMKAFMFPYINILWLGCLIMICGTILAVWQRIKLLKSVRK